MVAGWKECCFFISFFVVLQPFLANIRVSDLSLFSFLSSLTLSAYLKELSVFSQQEAPGETFAIITVLQFPTNESFKT